MNAWVTDIFADDQAMRGGLVRRPTALVSEYDALPEIVQRARDWGYHVIETGDEIVVLCHIGESW